MTEGNYENVSPGTMDHLALAARLEVIKWRDSQFEAVYDQLEAALPQLLEKVSITVDTCAGWRVSTTLKRKIEQSIQAWSTKQAGIASQRAEAALDIALSHLGNDIRIDNAMRDAMLAGVGAGAGVSMIAGSLAAIPAITAAATVKTGGIIFGLFATTTLSLPILIAGGVGVGLATLTGFTFIGRAKSWTKERAYQRLSNAVAQQVMGYGIPAGERSILTDIQAAILRSAENRLENIK